MPPETATPSAPSPLGFRLNPIVLFPGLAAALVLVADYRTATPVFCTEVGSGCTALKRSAFAHVAGLPTPFVGVAGLVLLFVLGLLRGRTVRSAHALAGGCGALAALGLVAVQITKGQYCQFCLVVDASAFIAGCIGLSRLSLGWEPPVALRPRVLRALLFGLATTAVAVFALGKRAPVPTPLAEELAKTPAGQVLVLDFLDFECPYCREAHQQNRALFAEYASRVRVVRKQVPLGSHPHAEPAARAALCGERFGQGEPMLEHLFDLDPNDMSPARFTKLAGALGIDEAAFAQCLADPALKARLDADRATWHAVGAEGLPTLYVGRERLVGLVPEPEVRAKLKAALDESHE